LQRHEEATCATSIFSDDATESSFALRYYRDSPELQRIHADIDRRASEERTKKREDLEALNKKWRKLKNEASDMDHDHDRGWRRCKKMSKEQRGWLADDWRP
jgi:hypothetical protein